MQNLLIKADSLYGLKYLLDQGYRSKVKLIYIDPPYNTGNDSFKYNDRFNYSTWLTFMKNRLEVAKDLLREDGVIFVQIDDKEQAYLKVLMDEIFDRKNFVGNFPRKAASNRAMAKDFSILHDYIICFKKSYKLLFSGKEKDISKYKNPDNDINGSWTTQNPSMAGSKNLFEIKNPYTGKIDLPPQGRGWVFNEDKMQDMIKNNIFIFKEIHKKNERGFYIKLYLSKISNTYLINSLELLSNNVLNQVATKNDIFVDFSNPKPEALIQRIIDMSTTEGDIVLDFFAGSGTTPAVAHKMKRQWIAIEQMDYIEDITKLRLQKVLEGEQGGISKALNWQGGGSFDFIDLTLA
jgi:adenine-specific DNA-methyltransferase